MARSRSKPNFRCAWPRSFGQVGRKAARRTAGGEDYEVQHFAERHGISPDEARRLIMDHAMTGRSWSPR